MSDSTTDVEKRGGLGLSQPCEKRKLDRNAYTVGWVCALPKEQTAAIAMLDNVHPDLPNMQPSSDTNAYTLGSIGMHNIVIACLPKGQIGTVSAANVASRMVSTFPSIRFGLMVGIGGGVPSNKVRLGDVVVSTPTGIHPGVVQWDMGKTKDGKFERTGALNNPPTFLLGALTKLETAHEMAGSKIQIYLDELRQKWPNLVAKYLRSEALRDVVFKPDSAHVEPDDTSSDEDEDRDLCRLCDKTKSKQRNLRDPKFHYGLIASGNQVVKDGIFRDRLNHDLGGNVLCFEMEAAGLMTNFPCLVIRGICDYSDAHKNKKWQEYAAAVAAASAKEFLSFVQPEVIEAEPSANDVLHEIRHEVERAVSGVEHLTRCMMRQEDVRVLDWLSTVNYGDQHSDNFGRHQPKTGQWFLESDVFQDWLEKQNQILFCTGIPGAGKTILASIVIDHLIKRFHHEDAIGIAFAYCDYQKYAQQRLNDLLASLARQLCQTRQDLPPFVMKLYNEHQARGTRPSSDELQEALSSTGSNYSKLFIVVDALDECQAKDGCRNSLISRLSAFKDKTGANILYTSRHIPEIEESVGDCMKQEIRATESDIGEFIDRNLSLQVNGEHLRSFVKSEVKKLAAGMFLLAKLYLGSLREKPTPAKIRETLKDIKSRNDSHAGNGGELHVIFEAYDDAIKRIDNQSPDFRDLGTQTIKWIVHAERQLSTLELQHALSVRQGDTQLNCDNIATIEVILSACAGLVTRDKKSDIVRLAHYTTQEYFESKRTDYFPDAQLQICEICLAYSTFVGKDDRELPKLAYGHSSFFGEDDRELSISDGHSSSIGDDDRELPILDGYSFSVGDDDRELPISDGHSSSVGDDDRELPMSNGYLSPVGDDDRELPMSDGYLSPVGGGDRELLMSDAYSSYVGEDDRELPMSAYAFRHWGDHARKAATSIPAAVGFLTDRRRVRESFEYLPLEWDLSEDEFESGMHLAATLNLQIIAATLVDHGFPVNCPGLTPLMIACGSGYQSFAQWLLDEGADPRATDRKGYTALCYASSHDNLAIMRMLLDKGVEVNVLRSESTLLESTVKLGSLDAVKMLLRNGADIQQYTDLDYRDTVLHKAFHWTLEIVKVLLDEAGNSSAVSTCNSHGQTPLHAVICDTDSPWLQDKTQEIAKLLIERGANVSTVDYHGNTPLLDACRREMWEVVELLHSKGAIINSTTGSGITPLHFASEVGEADVVQWMLKKGADVSATDVSGRTPLRMTEDVSTAQALIEGGASVSAADSSGDTPLHKACSRLQFDMVQLLLDNRAEICKNAMGRTPLHEVCLYVGPFYGEKMRDYKDCVRALRQNGAEVQAVDNDGKIPLDLIRNRLVYSRLLAGRA